MKIPRWQGIGLLESIWQLTAAEAPAGDIGKLSDEDIAMAIDYTGDVSVLITALTWAKWIDASPEHRLIVHHWSDHCDDFIHMKLARAKKFFADGSQPKLSRLTSLERKGIEEFYAAIRAHGVRTSVHVPCLALPMPMPSHATPIPCARRAPDPALPDGGMTEAEFDEGWNRHLKNIQRETKQLVYQAILSMDGRFDLTRYRSRHPPWCDYWDRHGWQYCSLTFLGWIENGMPLPPPEPKARSSGKITASEYLQSED